MSKDEFLKKAQKVCNKIFYSIDAGLIIVGILLIFLCFSTNDENLVQSRMVIGDCCMITGYLILPFGNYQKKKQIAKKLFIHFVLSLFSVFGLLGCVQYYLNGIPTNNKWYEISFACLLIILCSYICYIVISFSYSLYRLIREALSHRIDKSIENATSKIETMNKMIAAITSLIASVTPIIVSIFGIIKNFT